MTKTIVIALCASVLPSPATARDWRAQAENSRPTAFAGARLTLPLGKAGAKPSAQLTIAPARSTISDSGMLTTRVSGGLGLELTGKRPTLSIAGAPAKEVLGARKMGFSTVAWIGVGVAVVAVGGLLIWADHVRDSERSA